MLKRRNQRPSYESTMIGMVTTNPNTTCLDCTHLYYSSASPGYSEMTPGYDADMSCNKNHWVFDAFNDNLNELRAKFYTSRSCKDFKSEEPKS